MLKIHMLLVIVVHNSYLSRIVGLIGRLIANYGHIILTNFNSNLNLI